jgi:hypothetical protein
MMKNSCSSGDKSESKNKSKSICDISTFNKLLLVCNISILISANFTTLLPSLSSSSLSLSLFDKAAQHLFEIATSSSTTATTTTTTSSSSSSKTRKEFPADINEWKAMNLTTLGGLTDNDRLAVGKIYSNTNSIFEYGLGESTSIAAYVNVPRYSGVDSDPEYVSYARTLAPDYFRFYFADIGPTIKWGYPKNDKLLKNKFNYQVSSSLSEKNKTI